MIKLYDGGSGLRLNYGADIKILSIGGCQTRAFGWAYHGSACGFL